MHVAILVAAVIASSSTGFGAQTSESTVACCPAEWTLQSVVGARGGLPFDPLTFDTPRGFDITRINDGRWWAQGLVNVVVAVGWLAADRAAPVTDMAESFMHRPELNLGLPFGEDGPRAPWRVRLQVKVKHGRPTVGVTVTW